MKFHIINNLGHVVSIIYYPNFEMKEISHLVVTVGRPSGSKMTSSLL